MSKKHPQPKPLLEAALEYLALGWSVFPAKGKKPLVRWGRYQRALPTAEEVESWWSTWPDAQIALATGTVSGLIVLDLDGDEATESTAGLQFPKTPSARTGRGQHFYFAHPGLDEGYEIRNFARRLPGVDLRGDGGYVIMPPSLHSIDPDTELPHFYEWDQDPRETALAKPPAWLLELVEDTPSATKGGRRRAPPPDDDGNPWYLRMLAVGVDEGQRNDAIARLTGYFLAKGLDEEATLYTIETFNATKVRPPLPEDEVERTVRSIARAERRKQSGADVLHSEDYTEPEKRQTALELASAKLGFSIEGVIKFDADPAVYEIQAEGAKLRLGGIQALIEYTPFKRRIADGLGILIKLQRKDWPEVAEWLLSAVEQLDVVEATERGQFEARIAAYLEEYIPAAEDHWREAAWDNRPFERAEGGEICISLSGLRKYVANALGDKISTGDLAVTARALGLENHVVGVNLNGKQTTRSVWVLPEDLAGRVRTQTGRK